MKPVAWGVLSTAKIARNSVIPSMMTSAMCDIRAISSRSLEAARRVASELSIPKAYGSYEELLADPDIEAVYNPLPNHLHVPYTIKALEAGKHVLCEKPIAMTGVEAEELMSAATRFHHLVVMEAFMYRFHPQWDTVRRLMREGAIGEVKSIRAEFTYFNTDPANVRNQADIGGGGLLDIGCYTVDVCRFLLDRDPVVTHSIVELDPVFGTDRLASYVMDFDGVTAMGMCSTQLEHRQSVRLHGTTGTIDIAIPFNAANAQKRTIVLDSGGESRTIEFEECDQYVLQGEAFCRAVRGEAPVPIPLSSSLGTLRVLDAIRG
jgi:predicted dehydrogenase